MAIKAKAIKATKKITGKRLDGVIEAFFEAPDKKAAHACTRALVEGALADLEEEGALADLEEEGALDGAALDGAALDFAIPGLS